MRISLFPLGAVFVILLHSAQAAPAAAPANPQPSNAAQSFGDWGVRCTANAAPPCEMFQLVQNRAGNRILSIAIAYEPRQDRYAIQLTTPLGVTLAKGVRLSASALTVQPLPYRRCDGTGCYVDGAIERGALDSLGRSDPKAKVTIALNGRDTDLPISLRGFSDARTAMENMAREKLTATDPAPAKPPGPVSAQPKPHASR